MMQINFASFHAKKYNVIKLFLILFEFVRRVLDEDSEHNINDSAHF